MNPQIREHEVILWGRRLYRVSSASRSGLYHWCDLEMDVYPVPVCDCESFRLRKERPYCRHLAAIFWFITQCAPPEKQQAVYEILIESLPEHSVPVSTSYLLDKMQN